MMVIKEERGIINIIFVSFFVASVMLFVPVFIASAQAVLEEDINAQINTLKKQIEQLQIQITAVQSEESVRLPITTPSLSLITTTEYKFIRNLKKGDRGEDVRRLQIILNSDSETRIARAGVGSAGNETTYFGSLTKTAVIKFQNKYDSEVLIPLGLYKGTGYVGNLTRVKLNKMNIAGPTLASTSATPKTPITSDLIQSDELMVMYPSQYSGPVGTELVLFGAGFKENENYIIYFDDEYAIQDAKVLNSGALEFTIPDGIAFGKHNIWVTNGEEKSNDDAFFIVTDPLVPEPVIESTSPPLVKFGEEVTISGSGFTPTGNNIRAGYEVVENISSPDGKTLTFKVTPSVFKDALNDNVEFELQAYVENEKGVSNSVAFSFSLASQPRSVKALLKTLKRFVFGSAFTYAQAPGGIGLPFGGMITAVTYCPCSKNLLLTIGPPVGGAFTYQSGTSITYAYGQVYRPGPWTLGTQMPGGAGCWMYVVVGCAPLPSIGTVSMIGTSL